jgi:hypothetical protein
MSIAPRFQAVPKTLRAIPHKAKEGAFELRGTVRSVGQPRGDENVFNGIIEEFDLLFRGRGGKSQGFRYRDALQCV